VLRCTYQPRPLASSSFLNHFALCILQSSFVLTLQESVVACHVPKHLGHGLALPKTANTEGPPPTRNLFNLVLCLVRCRKTWFVCLANRRWTGQRPSTSVIPSNYRLRSSRQPLAGMAIRHLATVALIQFSADLILFPTEMGPLVRPAPSTTAKHITQSMTDSTMSLIVSGRCTFQSMWIDVHFVVNVDDAHLLHPDPPSKATLRGSIETDRRQSLLLTDCFIKRGVKSVGNTKTRCRWLRALLLF
jgi:hypothetical protein